MIRSEKLLREAREQDHTCEFCYYEFFDDKAYPCSRCMCNQPTENMWRPKVEDEPQTDYERGYQDGIRDEIDKQHVGR